MGCRYAVCRFLIDVVDGGQFGPRVVGHVCGMHLPDTATAQDGNSQHSVLPLR